MKGFIANHIVQECRRKLLATKAELMNRAKQCRIEFSTNDKNYGDEIDQSVAFLAEHNYLVTQERIRHQLFEIESALSRIEQGVYGICEETQEPIETERLLALPFTTLSIEGAEIREALRHRRA